MNKPNILFIAIDTLRADHLGCYGYDQPTSPFIDSIAAQSVVYENCFSHAPWTIPSFTTIMSGLDPIKSRIVASPWNIPNYTPIKFDDLKLLLPEALREAGYRTMAVDNLVEMASHPSWFIRGFHEYINLTDRLFLRHHHVLAEQVTDVMLDWKGTEKEEPWFAFLHYWDPHLPYNYPKEYDEKLKKYRPEPIHAPDGRKYLPRRGYDDELPEEYLELVAQYDRSILYMDDQIKRLFEGLKKKGAMDNTIVVMVGDHGEAMVEHGVLFDHSLLYDPTTHVPLIIYDPNTKSKGTIKDIAQHHDIAPTLLRLANVELDWPTTGHVLAPFGSDNARPFAISIQDGGAAIRTIRTHEWKLICHYDTEQDSKTNPPAVKRVELYDLKEDPFELVDIAQNRPDQVKHLMAMMESWRKEKLADGQTDPLLEKPMRINFFDYPGDPVLVEFYKDVRAVKDKK